MVLNIPLKNSHQHWSVYIEIQGKIEQFPNLFVNKLFGGSLKMPTKCCVKKSEKITPNFSKICPRELSFHTKHLFKKIYLVYYFETIHWKLSISWIYSETNLASSHNPQNPLPRLFKTVCNKLFLKHAKFNFKKIQLGMPFTKSREYTKNLFARVYITQSCF